MHTRLWMQLLDHKARLWTHKSQDILLAACRLNGWSCSIGLECSLTVTLKNAENWGGWCRRWPPRSSLGNARVPSRGVEKACQAPSSSDQLCVTSNLIAALKNAKILECKISTKEDCLWTQCNAVMPKVRKYNGRGWAKAEWTSQIESLSNDKNLSIYFINNRIQRYHAPEALLC